MVKSLSFDRNTSVSRWFDGVPSYIEIFLENACVLQKLPIITWALKKVALFRGSIIEILKKCVVNTMFGFYHSDDIGYFRKKLKKNAFFVGSIELGRGGKFKTFKKKKKIKRQKNFFFLWKKSIFSQFSSKTANSLGLRLDFWVWNYCGAIMIKVFSIKWKIIIDKGTINRFAIFHFMQTKLNISIKKESFQWLLSFLK